MTQYGIRLMSKDFKDISFIEFKALLAGLSSETPLGKIVSIRAENNPDILKNFTKEQHKIRNDYRKKIVNNIDEVVYESALESIKQAFISMVGV